MPLYLPQPMVREILRFLKGDGTGQIVLHTKQGKIMSLSIDTRLTVRAD